MKLKQQAKVNGAIPLARIQVTDRSARLSCLLTTRSFLISVANMKAMLPLDKLILRRALNVYSNI